MNVHGLFSSLFPLNYSFVIVTFYLMLTALNQMIRVTSTYFHWFQMFILYGIIFIYLYWYLSYIL